jgi:4'-phosphopantetheinyl transferase EntD
MIEKLFSNQVVALNATQGMWEGNLYPEEQECIRKAVPKRRREFTAGRLCAREVLLRLGFGNFPLLVGPDRAPLWPKNIVGSISHCSNLCVVAATKDKRIKGLGVDVEVAGPLDIAVKELVCTKKEKLWIANTQPLIGSDLAKIIFSAKESLYKSLFSFTRTPLDFMDFQVEIDAQTNEFDVELFNEQATEFLKQYNLIGRYFCSADFVFTGVEIRKQD